ncbi:hypothetical protein BaOVIS_002120 [Babesia ovis]|uniref:Uncharacterized protein n=1 Tax=Babesia ovis TaxID=5869 RepID=A0A9W5T7X6_BABOV|nr:hypothetical protein BaOVIS_002120 [Babesia ovis]
MKYGEFLQQAMNRCHRSAEEDRRSSPQAHHAYSESASLPFSLSAQFLLSHTATSCCRVRSNNTSLNPKRFGLRY